MDTKKNLGSLGDLGELGGSPLQRSPRRGAACPRTTRTSRTSQLKPSHSPWRGEAPSAGFSKCDSPGVDWKRD